MKISGSSLTHSYRVSLFGQYSCYFVHETRDSQRRTIKNPCRACYILVLYTLTHCYRVSLSGQYSCYFVHETRDSQRRTIKNPCRACYILILYTLTHCYRVSLSGQYSCYFVHIGYFPDFEFVLYPVIIQTGTADQ
jgi:hypothetical protein